MAIELFSAAMPSQRRFGVRTGVACVLTFVWFWGWHGVPDAAWALFVPTCIYLAGAVISFRTYRSRAGEFGPDLFRMKPGEWAYFYAPLVYGLMWACLAAACLAWALWRLAL